MRFFHHSVSKSVRLLLVLVSILVSSILFSNKLISVNSIDVTNDINGINKRFIKEIQSENRTDNIESDLKIRQKQLLREAVENTELLAGLVKAGAVGASFTALTVIVNNIVSTDVLPSVAVKNAFETPL